MFENIGEITETHSRSVYGDAPIVLRSRLYNTKRGEEVSTLFRFAGDAVRLTGFTSEMRLTVDVDRARGLFRVREAAEEERSWKATRTNKANHESLFFRVVFVSKGFVIPGDEPIFPRIEMAKRGEVIFYVPNLLFCDSKEEAARVVKNKLPNLVA